LAGQTSSGHSNYCVAPHVTDLFTRPNSTTQIVKERGAVLSIGRIISFRGMTNKSMLLEDHDVLFRFKNVEL